jgi:hypothetical protein
MRTIVVQVHAYERNHAGRRWVGQPELGHPHVM